MGGGGVAAFATPTPTIIRERQHGIQPRLSRHHARVGHRVVQPRPKPARGHGRGAGGHTNGCQSTHQPRECPASQHVGADVGQQGARPGGGVGAGRVGDGGGWGVGRQVVSTLPLKHQKALLVGGADRGPPGAGTGAVHWGCTRAHAIVRVGGGGGGGKSRSPLTSQKVAKVHGAVLLEGGRDAAPVGRIQVGWVDEGREGGRVCGVKGGEWGIRPRPLKPTAPTSIPHAAAARLQLGSGGQLGTWGRGRGMEPALDRHARGGGPRRRNLSDRVKRDARRHAKHGHPVPGWEQSRGGLGGGLVGRVCVGLVGWLKRVFFLFVAYGFPTHTHTTPPSPLPAGYSSSAPPSSCFHSASGSVKYTM